MEDEHVDGTEDVHKDTKKILISIAIIVVAIGFIISLRFIYDDGPQIEQYTYNGFTFTQQAGLWHTQWQRGTELYNIRLRYGPREVEDIPLAAPGAGINVSDTLYLTFDPGPDLKYVALAASELSLNLKQVFNLSPVAACTVNVSEPCYDRPIITCENTDDAVIYIREDPEAALLLTDNCIIVQGEGEDLARAADKLIWIQYGIITS